MVKRKTESKAKRTLNKASGVEPTTALFLACLTGLMAAHNGKLKPEGAASLAMDYANGVLRALRGRK
jgi:hypothetical protein